MSDLLAGFTNGEGEWLQVLTNLVNWKNQRKGSRFLGGATLCGRLVASLKFLCPRCPTQEPGAFSRQL